MASANTSIDQIQRYFAPASEWVYFKLYCSDAQADRLIVRVISPLVTAIKQKRIAGKWFFIRYTDPDFHIRLRFHSADPRCVNEIIALVAEALAAAPGDLQVWKIQLDTYNREMERYGPATITNAETIFCIDSEAVLTLLQPRLLAPDADISWYWLMLAIDQMLNAFSLSLANKQELLKTMRDGFSQEVNANGSMNQQIDTRYRAIKQKTEKILAGASGSLTEVIVRELSKRSALLQQEALRVKDALEQHHTSHPLDSLLRSYIHMTCNRVFPNNTRKQEFILYDFLLRYYNSQLAREKSKMREQQDV